MNRTAVKRVLDVAVALGALVVSLPAGLVAAMLIKATSRGPVLFRQERVGLHEARFQMLKFRSMTTSGVGDDRAQREAIRLEIEGRRAADEHGSYKVADTRCISRVGRWLRSTSIDELPQLWNVLRGEMSIVGPRPALPWEVELFPVEYRRRAEVPPGITGLWQVSGRSRLDTLDMLRLDVEYVDRWSPGLDLRIMLRTLRTLCTFWRGEAA